MLFAITASELTYSLPQTLAKVNALQAKGSALAARFVLALPVSLWEHGRVESSEQERRNLVKKFVFVIGLIIGFSLIPVGVYLYFAGGYAPVATSAPPMPF
jgi:hypothetical protein